MKRYDYNFAIMTLNLYMQKYRFGVWINRLHGPLKLESFAAKYPALFALKGPQLSPYRNETQDDMRLWCDTFDFLTGIELTILQICLDM